MDIIVKNLSFSYGSEDPVLNGLSMQVPTGSIYGFLGNNGAGKSTTIRTILGLLKPTSGKVEILGEAIPTKSRTLYKSIGTLIEAPSLYPNLTGREHLNIACKYFKSPSNRISEILDLVSLSETGNKRSSSYSMGMKQRLGIAMALIHDPKLLILDEPTNGLDPLGIQQIRSTLIRLKEVGKTILLSSHLLHEIEKTASHVGILKNGKLVFEGLVSDLKQAQNEKMVLQITLSNPKKACQVVGGQVIAINDKQIEIKGLDESNVSEILRKLLTENIEIFEVVQNRVDLENIFLSLNQSKSL